MINTIKESSIETWKHINIHGEFDFSDNKLQDSIGLNMNDILDLDLAINGHRGKNREKVTIRVQ